MKCNPIYLLIMSVEVLGKKALIQTHLFFYILKVHFFVHMTLGKCGYESIVLTCQAMKLETILEFSVFIHNMMHRSHQ